MAQQNNTKQVVRTTEIKAKILPSDFVQTAENFMYQMQETDKRGNRYFELTTTQIRNILSMVNDIYNEAILLEEDVLPEKLVDKILSMKIRMIYECGRQQAVRKFVDKTQLLGLIKGIGNNKERFLRFAKYLEALVAYHRYYGGRE